jgi:hypothetical protein
LLSLLSCTSDRGEQYFARTPPSLNQLLANVPTVAWFRRVPDLEGDTQTFSDSEAEVARGSSRELVARF